MPHPGSGHGRISAHVHKQGGGGTGDVSACGHRGSTDDDARTVRGVVSGELGRGGEALAARVCITQNASI
jgi:hypothetical protein